MTVYLATPTVADLSALTELQRATFREAYMGAIADDDLNTYIDVTFTGPQVLAELTDQQCHHRWLVGAMGPVGYCKSVIQPTGEKAGTVRVELAQIYLRSSARGRGLGRGLFDSVVRLSRSLGAIAIDLGVWEHNEAAIAAYRRWGFEVTDEQTFMLGEHRQRDLVMSRLV